MPAVDQAPPHGAIVDPSELAAVPGSMLDAAKAYAADVLSLPAEPPRTLPVTPAERALATCLRAWLDWTPACPEGNQSAEDVMCTLGEAMANYGFVGARDNAPTDAGAALLARVEADRSAEDIARDLVMALQTSGAPGVLVSEAQSVLVNVRACARIARVEAAERTPDAPPGICQGQMHAYRCALPVGHTGLHADEGRFTLWPDAADTRPVVDAADAKGLT